MTDLDNVLLVPKMTYAIECAENKFYVGITYNVNHRIAEHLQGKGAKWTRLYKPTGKIVSVQIGNKEKETTLALMRENGWQNVRGAGWCRIDMKNPPKEFVEYDKLHAAA